MYIVSYLPVHDTPVKAFPAQGYGLFHTVHDLGHHVIFEAPMLGNLWLGSLDGILHCC